jgi:glycogen debranching enzyme
MSLPEETGERRGLLPRFTLKDGDTFLLADALGDIQSSDDGLFMNDTRMLSRWELAIAGRRPSLLGAAITHDNTLFIAHLTNRPLPSLGERSIPQGVIHLERSRLLWNSRLYEKVKLTNFSDVDAEMPLKLRFEADFADIFEVQGHVRAARGETQAPRAQDRCVELSYRGRDDKTRTTVIAFSQLPRSLSGTECEFALHIERGASAEMYVEVGIDAQPAPSAQRFETALRGLSKSMGVRLERGASISSAGPLFEQWIDRSRSDLALLTTELPTGPYPYAGIPWFATQFGRDAIITALQVLWVNPAIAAGVLRFLAATQAQEESAFRDSQPGKIMHETRRGEMAMLREVPFARYYGGVDTTPLFVMLAGAYEQRTGDASLVDEIWPSLLAATAWIERRLDTSPTGFLDYSRGEKSGLVNQAWKDSHDSMFHADGSLPAGPVAVVEVQGYAFAALNAMADLAGPRGDQARSDAWRRRAEHLRAAIEEQFWIPEMGFYAIALDGAGAPCKVYGSNAGHLLFCGVPAQARAESVVRHLVSARFSSGWGIRTLAEGQARYNPMSYHNGSIWPHDTAICAAGISRYGHRTEAVRILDAIFETAHHFSLRLPELYCGFPRIEGQGPAPYPVACLPQAWASGSMFMLLQAALGIRIDGKCKEVHLNRPLLPAGVGSLNIRDISVADARIGLHFERVADEVVVVPAGTAGGAAEVLAHL